MPTAVSRIRNKRVICSIVNETQSAIRLKSGSIIASLETVLEILTPAQTLGNRVRANKDTGKSVKTVQEPDRVHSTTIAAEIRSNQTRPCATLSSGQQVKLHNTAAQVCKPPPLNPPQPAYTLRSHA